MARKDWIAEIQSHYRERLTFPELRKGVVALSRIYVEKRSAIERGAVFDGAGKRAAFACFYSPLHFLTVSEVVRALGAETPAPGRIIDLGCGLGVAGGAWALACREAPPVVGFEKNPWAAGEARRVLATLSLRATVHQKPLRTAPMARRGEGVVAAFTVNELDSADRSELLHRFLKAASLGASVLVVEPIARRMSPWWDEWSERFREASGREDAFRFDVALPEPLAALDRAAGLDHRELTARTLFLRGPSPKSS